MDAVNGDDEYRRKAYSRSGSARMPNTFMPVILK